MATTDTLDALLSEAADDAATWPIRAHFLSGYDSNENEEGDYFIYREN